MADVEAWRALGELQTWDWRRPSSVEESTFETSLRLALLHPQSDLVIALDVLEAWDWQRPDAVSNDDFERVLCVGTAALGAGESREAVALARASRKRSETRLAAYLPVFTQRLVGADEVRSSTLLDDALRWSENAFEAEVLRCCARVQADHRERGLDDKSLGVDDLILRAASPRWQKVAMIVGLVVSARRSVRDTEVARHVEELVARGLLEGQGDLSQMRFSEVRIPPSA